MNKQEVARLVASLTDVELEELRDFLAEPDDFDPHASDNGQFLGSLLGGGDD